MMLMFFLGLVLGMAVGGLLVLLSDKMIDKYLPEECPPCNHDCRQGRDCPAGFK